MIQPKLLLQLLIICFTWYLLGSFVAADFNISNWPWGGRYLTAVLMVASAVGVIVFNYSHVPKK